MTAASDSNHASRRAFIAGVSASTLGALALGGCAGTQRSAAIDPAFRRTVVPFQRREQPGTTVVDPQSHYLYFVQKGGQAIRYGGCVGGDGFVWSGVAT